MASALTTAVSQTTANPDGTLTLTQTAAPTRVLKDGAWTAIDPTLTANPDGTLSPKAAPSSVVLSGGGTGPLLSLHTGGQGFTLTLPTSLPAPTLSGPSAAYAGVLPGVDLTVTVDPSGGVSDVFTLHTPAAARNPQLATLLNADIATTPGLTVGSDANGTVQVKDAAGHPIYTAPTPLAWDSADTAAATPDTTAEIAPATANALRRDASGARPSSALRRGAAARNGRVGVTAGHGRLALTPPAALLGASDTQYPVYLDPTYSPSYGSTGWASPGSGVPSQNFWKSSVSYTGDAEVGPSGDVQDEAISLFNFPVTTSLKTAKIYSASFDITETYSWACPTSGHNQTVDLYAPTKVLSSSNATWNSWSGSLGSKVDSHSFALGYNSGCPAGGAPPFDVTSTIAKDLTAGTTTQTLAMRADSHTDNYALKRFKAGSAQLVITYDKYPNTPKGLFTSPKTNCKDTLLGDTAVSLYAPVSTPTGAALTTTFTLYKTADTAKTNLLTSANGIAARTYHGASGQNAVLKLPETFFKKVASGGLGTFSWTVTTSDGTLSSKASATPCTFGWDASRPGAPDIAPATAPRDGGRICPTLDDPDTGAVQPIGARCSFSITPPSGQSVSGYAYQINQSSPVTVDAKGALTITVPVSRLVNTLTVTAFSPGGNLGQPASTEFLGTAITPAAADGDVNLDGTPDLVTVGGPGSSLPSGAWLAAGHPYGSVSEAATDIGVGGLQTDDEAGTPKPSDWDGAQAVTGDFCGNGAQDVLAYFSADGSGAVVCNDGSSGALAPGNPTTIGTSSAPYEIPDGTFTDADGTPATQVVTAGDTSGAHTGLPDLLATMDNTLYLTYSFTANGYGFLLDPDWGTCASCYALTALNTPDGTQDWDSWTLTTSQLSTGTALYLWNPATGELDLWTGLGISADGTTLTTAGRIQLAAAGWNQAPAHPLTLRAADLGGDGNPSLWTVDRTTGHVTPYLFNGTTLTPQTAQTVSNPSHVWPLKDGTDGQATTAADTVGTLDLHGGTGATWNDSDDQHSPDAAFNGTSAGVLTSTGPAVTTNAAFTVSAWVKPETLDTKVLEQEATVEPGFVLYSNSTDNSWRFAMATSDTGPTWDITQSRTNAAIPGFWTHLVANYDPGTSTMALYVDGALQGKVKHTKTSWNATHSFDIGEFFSSGSRSSFFKGQVSDVQTWNSVLTAAQIADLSGARPAATPSGPLASKVPGVCADDPSGATANGTKVQVYTCNGSPAQNWTAYPDGTLHPGSHAKICVDVASAGTTAGSLVQLDACSTSAAQQWQVLDDGQVKNAHSGLCLADPGSTTTLGTQLALAACDNGTAVTWSIPQTGAVNEWMLNETGGTTAHDAVAADTATATGGVTWGTSTDSAGRTMPAATFDGTGSLGTQHWGVDTTGSFAVSAWVNVTDLSKYQTILSEGGTTSYAFDLYYSPVYQAWIFNRSATDTTNPTLVRSKSTDNPAIPAPAVNTWTLLTGVYDATTDPAHPTVRLYVNGMLASAIPFPYTPWDTHSHLDIGRDFFNGAYNPDDLVTGSLADVRHYDRPLTDQEAYALYDDGTGIPASAAHWRLDEASGSTAADAVGDAHDATLHGTAAWNTADHGGSLALDGTTGYLDTAGPVLDTGNSMTVSAWVKLKDTSVNSTFVAADGVHTSVFQLYYSTTYGWTFNRLGSDVDTPVITRSYSGTAAVHTGVWTHLVGVYDKGSGTVRLYVDGIPQTPNSFTTPWTGEGNFQLGRRRSAGVYGEYAKGSLADVTLWSTALTPTQIANLG
ncbi:LamG-like jellyroll fold domain-containing protein [Streptomyces sp. NPDC021224]|uniref:LamG-like jellyroll fold domain-containing protein n=1 Tax=unclassified Streptomyces TaxID=2593676 RepID=UPI0037B8CCF8